MSSKAASQVTERSLYPFISSYLEKLNFNSISELKSPSGQLDLLATKDGEKFIIEVKIGDQNKKIIEGLAQAMDYARDHDTHNVMVIDYPNDIRETLIEDLKYYTLCSPAYSFISTAYLQGSCDKKTVKEVLDKLNENFENRRIAEVDLQLIIKVISEAISNVTQTLNHISKEDMNNLIRLITGKYDLFLALSELKNNNESNNVALNLVSYLIINQLLFYHMFANKSGKIPPLHEINSINDLKKQFKNITDIDYKAIYQINIIDRLPENDEIIRAFNDIINVFKLVQPELIEHDLMGRLFHDLLPYETRKILAAFYTNPIAGDILAGLCIDSQDDNVIDFACGSGTLLVSAYNRKRDLSTIADYHKYFVENEISGIDIMPFAAHLTAVNLSSQSIETTTESLNVAVMDSLSLSKEFKTKRVFKLDNFSRELQTTIDLFTPQQRRLTGYVASQSKGAVSADGMDNTFKISRNSFDVCIGNPPFSDREKLPNDYLETLKGYKELTDICGSQINLWGYFIALSTFLLKKNGRLGFVIPINIFRGLATQKIRDYVLNNFTIEYVVKTGKNIAFSENAGFRDILLVARYQKPTESSVVTFALLNEDLHYLDFRDARNIASFIKGEIFTTGKNIEIGYINQQDLIDNSTNLMPYFGFMKAENGKIFVNFNSKIEEKIGDKLKKIPNDVVFEGFHTSPGGVSQMAFVTNNLSNSRISRAFLITDGEDEENLYAKIKNFEGKRFTIPKSNVKPAFRTLTSISSLNLDGKLDYIITDEFEDYKTVLDLSKFNQDKYSFSYKKYVRSKMDKNWTYIVVGRRFNPHSPNTSLFAFSSEEKFIPADTCKRLALDKLSSKINTLYLNSAISIFNVLSLRQQTTGHFSNLLDNDFMLLDILDVEKLSDLEIKKLLDLYDEMKDVDFPSLTEQFSTQNKFRVKLDKKLLLILGFDDGEINALLPEVYKAIAYELKNG